MIGKPNELIVFLANAPQKTYELKEHREKRTLTQNAYYWKLLTQVADRMRMSKTEAHNRMMRDYGRVWEYGLGVWRKDGAGTDRAMLRDEILHFKPTSKTMEKDGIQYRQWILLKPSHLMTTEEMSVLVNGLVQEAQSLDIETLTPRELEEIRQYEIQKQTRKSDRHTKSGKAEGA